MSTLTVTRTYPQPPSEVFAALNDFAGVYRFHPLLESSPLVEGTPAAGPGSERVCHLNDGNTLHERLVNVKANESLTVEVVDTSMPVSRMIAQFTLVQTSDGGTELTMTADFELKMGFLGKVLDKLVVARKFQGNLDLLLVSLGEYLQTGRPVARAFKAAS
jgi:uncharacterized protein YndB with AHSA1/START domain